LRSFTGWVGCAIPNPEGLAPAGAGQVALLNDWPVNTSTPNPCNQTYTKSTHSAAMIYYRKLSQVVDLN